VLPESTVLDDDYSVVQPDVTNVKGANFTASHSSLEKMMDSKYAITPLFGL